MTASAHNAFISLTDKILSNLISNAHKFTHINGIIKLSIEQTEVNGEKAISISVTDNGIGIPEAQQEKIFERFYQGKGNAGFGIGLAFSKNLAKLHNGNLEVKSKPGEGARFILTIPYIESMENDDRLTTADAGFEYEKSWQPLDYEETEHVVTRPGNCSEERVILLAEDNTDLREFVAGYLSDSYTVICAENGEDAFKIATQQLPDIIITDIMMPVVDGMELAKKLAENINTNHIPVIFLTAKDKASDQLAGVETGAVDYIIKPFNMAYLHKKIDNLLHTLKRQQEKARANFLHQSEPENIQEKENKFLKKAIDIVHANLNDSDFDVTKFCEALGVSRMQLHRKLKGTIGQSATEFVRSVRIKHAAGLLRQGQHNVSQAMYEACFDNPSYFTKSFKKIYGVNPSEYTG